MKIALLLTGQLRTYEMAKWLHMNSLISKYDTDIFLSIDLDNSKQVEHMNKKQKSTKEEALSVVEFFNPIDYFIMEDFSDEFNNIINKNKKIKNINNYKGMFEQYYIVKNAYKMLINHINLTNKEYDIIIRLRFDQFLFTDESNILYKLNKTDTNQIIYSLENIDLLKNLSVNYKITFDEILENTIYLFGFGDFFHYKYANDQFFYHNSKLINLIFMFYDNILELIEYCLENNIGNKGAIYETIWYQFLINNNIIIKKSNINGIFVREFTSSKL